MYKIKIIMQRGARDLALRPPGNLFHKVLKPARKGNHEVDATTGFRPPVGRFFCFRNADREPVRQRGSIGFFYNI